MNKVTLIGRLGADVELKHLDGGNTVGNFSLATTEKYKNKQGETVEETQWHRIEVWGKQAEILAQYVKKGNQLALEGKLVYQDYEKEGVKHTVAKVKLSQFWFIHEPNKGSQSAHGSATTSSANSSVPESTTVEEDDLPF